MNQKTCYVHRMDGLNKYVELKLQAHNKDEFNKHGELKVTSP